MTKSMVCLTVKNGPMSNYNFKKLKDNKTGKLLFVLSIKVITKYKCPH